VRGLFRRLAPEGRTVFVSSHLTSEMQHTADHLVVIGRGRLIADESLIDFGTRSAKPTVSVRTPDTERFAVALRKAGAQVRPEAGALSIGDMSAVRIGELAFAHQVTLHELTTHTTWLETAFMDLTADSVEYAAGDAR
jgi:ABC-2 type transport system ATP-binding protein